jgi:hypothetical protein
VRFWAFNLSPHGPPADFLHSTRFQLYSPLRHTRLTSKKISAIEVDDASRLRVGRGDLQTTNQDEEREIWAKEVHGGEQTVLQTTPIGLPWWPGLRKVPVSLSSLSGTGRQQCGAVGWFASVPAKYAADGYATSSKPPVGVAHVACTACITMMGAE